MTRKQTTTVSGTAKSVRHFLISASVVLFLLMGQAVPAFQSDEQAASKEPAARPETKAALVHEMSADQAEVVRQAERSGVKMEWHSRLGTPLSIRGQNLGQRQSYSGGKGLAFKGGGNYEANAVAVMAAWSSWTI